MIRSVAITLIFTLVSVVSSLYVDQTSKLQGHENSALNSHDLDLARTRRQSAPVNWPIPVNAQPMNVWPPVWVGMTPPPPPPNARPTTPRTTSRPPQTTTTPRRTPRPNQRATPPKPTSRPTQRPTTPRMTQRPVPQSTGRPLPPFRPVPAQQPPPSWNGFSGVPAGPIFPQRQPHQAFSHFYD